MLSGAVFRCVSVACSCVLWLRSVREVSSRLGALDLVVHGIGAHSDEELARQSQGYEILAQNYRSGKSEIDLIVQKDKTLVFVEVKTRSRTDFGMPEDWVNEQQAEKIIEGAEDYIEDRKWEGDIRFDIISIIIKSVPEIEHFEDAFY